MKNRNAYFKIITKEDGTYLKTYAPIGVGALITYNDITSYLIKNNIHNYDIDKINLAISNQSQDREIKLLNDNSIRIDESVNIDVRNNNMEAFICLYPPSTNGSLLSKSDIMRILKQGKIEYGIDEKKIDNILLNREYCKEFLIAKGTPMKQGANAYITYNFNTDLTNKPKSNEDGSVDFHKLDIISHCKQGDLLAVLTPEVLGTPGYDVYAKTIPAATVKRKYLKKGKNLNISDDGLHMYAATDGHVVLENGEVKVYNVFEVRGSVDNSTGDIDYNGDVVIKGNVITGFSVKATGNIDIDGVVEGASIKAGGHVILKRGMQGMNKGTIIAKGHVIAKFIENSTVRCGGYLSTDSIMHSEVSADGEIVVSGRRGFVSGGKIRSGSSISVKTVGSMMGTITVLEVGISPDILDEYAKLDKELKTAHENKQKILTGLNQFRKKIAETGQASTGAKNYVKQLLENHAVIDTLIKDNTSRINSIREIMENSTGTVDIQGVAYPGTTIVISNVYYLVKEVLQYSKLIRDGAEIKVMPL